MNDDCKLRSIVRDFNTCVVEPNRGLGETGDRVIVAFCITNVANAREFARELRDSSDLVLNCEGCDMHDLDDCRSGFGELGVTIHKLLTQDK